MSEEDSIQDELISLLKDIEENSEIFGEELQNDIDAKSDEQNSPSNSNQFNVNLQRRLWEQSKGYRQVTEWFMKLYGNMGISYQPFPSCKQSHISETVCRWIFDIYKRRLVNRCIVSHPITCM